jgi:hypothetical protein
MGQLLNDVRTAAAEADHSDSAPRDAFFSVCAKEGLAVVSIGRHDRAPLSKTCSGAPMMLMLAHAINFLSPGRHAQAEPWSRLRMMMP